MRATRRRRGLTLIEIVVALAIVAILATIAVPSLRQLMIQQRLKATANELLNDLQAARVEALKRREGLVAIVVRSNADSTCYGVVRAINNAANITCDCAQPAANFCKQTGMFLDTIKLQVIAKSSGINVGSTGDAYLSPYTGMMEPPRVARTTSVAAAGSGQINVTLSETGLAHACVPAGTNLSGFEPCLP